MCRGEGAGGQVNKERGKEGTRAEGEKGTRGIRGGQKKKTHFHKVEMAVEICMQLVIK